LERLQMQRGRPRRRRQAKWQEAARPAGGTAAWCVILLASCRSSEGAIIRVSPGTGNLASGPGAPRQSGLGTTPRNRPNRTPPACARERPCQLGSARAAVPGRVPLRGVRADQAAGRNKSTSKKSSGVLLTDFYSEIDSRSKRARLWWAGG
jgi:hypothetical protein